MSVPIRGDRKRKKLMVEGEKGKKHSVHVTTFITSLIYMYVHGDQMQPGLTNPKCN